MKKQIISRAIKGLPLGIAINCVITIIISLLISDGKYHPYVPQFAEIIGSEINAVIAQTILTALLGSCFSMATIIWGIESWSIAKQSLVYFLITSIFMMPVAYITNWMPHSLKGFLIYFSIFIIIFIIIWFIQYLFWKGKVDRINKAIRNK